MKLFTTAKSANGRKPLVLLHLLGMLDRCEVIDTDVYAGAGRKESYLAINPSGKVPTLVDGDLVLPESNAILGYLVEAYGGAKPTAARRAEVARWMFWEASEWQPALTAVLRETVAHQLGLAAQPPKRPRWDAAHRVIELLDTHLQTRAFVAGDLTIADVAIAGMMTYAKKGDFPFARYLHVRSWFEVIEAMPAWKATGAAPWV